MNGAPVSEWLNLQPFWQVLGISIFMLFLGPVEEFGWRGFLLPLMQRIMTPALAGLIIGLLWAVWHIPAFYLDGTPHTAWSMFPFIIGVTSVGVVMAVVYNKTHGNLLFPILIHWQLNIQFWPEAQPWENYLNLALALLLLWVHRDVMFGRDKGLTQVVPSLAKCETALGRYPTDLTAVGLTGERSRAKNASGLLAKTFNDHLTTPTRRRYGTPSPSTRSENR